MEVPSDHKGVVLMLPYFSYIISQRLFLGSLIKITSVDFPLLLPDLFNA